MENKPIKENGAIDSMHEMKVIAHIRTPFPTKFGIPRQSGLVPIRAQIVMEPEYRTPDAFRGIEGFSHLWLIWQFSEAKRDGWSATVRPPRLGGNTRMGVFATRSPFRPNPIGLSSVKLESVEIDEKEGVILNVSGADLMDGTPIYDIKPYLPFTDSHPDARGGFADPIRADHLCVILPDSLANKIPEDERKTLIAILQSDPRPSYQNDPERIYGMPFRDYEVRFSVCEDRLTVVEIKK